MSALPADFRVDVVKASVLNAEQLVYDYLRGNQFVDSVNRKVRA